MCLFLVVKEMYLWVACLVSRFVYIVGLSGSFVSVLYAVKGARNYSLVVRILAIEIRDLGLIPGSLSFLAVWGIFLDFLFSWLSFCS